MPENSEEEEITNEVENCKKITASGLSIEHHTSSSHHDFSLIVPEWFYSPETFNFFINNITEKNHFNGIDGCLLNSFTKMLRLIPRNKIIELEPQLKPILPWIIFTYIAHQNILGTIQLPTTTWTAACTEFILTFRYLFREDHYSKFSPFWLACNISLDAIDALHNNDVDHPLVDRVLKRIVGRSLGKVETRESLHPYMGGVRDKIVLKNASNLIIVFDPRSCVSKLEFAVDPNFVKKRKTRNMYDIPFEVIEIASDTVYYQVHRNKGDVLWGYKFVVIPVYTDTGIDELLANENKEKGQILLNKYRDYHSAAPVFWTKERDEQLLELMQFFMEQDTKDGYFLEISYFTEWITFPENVNIIKKWNLLEDIELTHILYRVSLLIEVNDGIPIISACISFTKEKSNSLSDLFIQHKKYFLFQVKLDAILDNLQYIENEIPFVTLTRDDQMFSDDSKASNSITDQLMQQLPSALGFGKFKQMFTVSFTNEDGVDEGGLYRETLSLLVDEIQYKSNLFIPTPNFKNRIGENRNSYIPNPSCTSQKDIQQFEFFGRIIAGCILSATQLGGLYWPIFIWKIFLDIPIDLDDIKSIDSICFQSIEMLENIQLYDISPESFTEEIMLHFTIMTLDGREVDLIENGSNILVTWERRNEYTDLVKNYRLRELDLQFAALKRGFDFQMLSNTCISLFLPEDLKKYIVGDQNIDVSTLELHTTYIDCSVSAPVIGYLWQTLHAFDDFQRRAFIKFTSGSSSLPSNTWPQRFSVRVTSGDDNHLPVAHTCSWELDIPNYSSAEILKRKLLQALEYCGDFGLA